MKIYKSNNIRRKNIQSVISGTAPNSESTNPVVAPANEKLEYKTMEVKGIDMGKIEDLLKKLPSLERIGFEKIDEFLRKLNVLESDNRRLSDLDMKNNKIVNLKTPEDDSDAVTKLFLATFISKKLLNIQKPSEANHAVNKEYVDSKKQNMCIFSSGIQDGLNMKYFFPYICLENCTLKKIQFTNVTQQKGDLVMHSRKVNEVGEFNKTTIGSKTKNGDYYEYPIEKTLNEKHLVFFSFDAVALNSNIVLFYNV